MNYAAGPLLVLLALVPWRKQRALAVGLGLSLIGIVGFSMNISFVSRPLLALIPPLRSFRVPTRAVLPWLLVLPALVSGRPAAVPSGKLPRRRSLAASPPARSRRRPAAEKQARLGPLAGGGCTAMHDSPGSQPGSSPFRRVCARR